MFQTRFIFVFFLFMVFTLPVNSQQSIFGDYMLFGEREIEKKNYKQAIIYLNSALSHRPASGNGYFLRGKAKYNLGDYIGAEKDFTQAAIYDPYNSEVYHYRAIVKSLQHNFGGALNDYSTAIKLYPLKPLYYLNKSKAFLNLHEFDSAIVYINKTIARKYAGREVLVLRGLANAGLGQYRQALNDMNKAIAIDPDHIISYVERGSIYLELNNPDSAMRDYNSALEIDPGNTYALNKRALARIETSDSSGALRDLNEVIGNSPNNSYAYYNRAILRLGKGDEKGTIEDLDRVISLNPENIAVYLYRGMIKRQAGDQEGAIADFDKAIEIYPEFADAYYERSQTKKQMQDYKGAERDYKFAYLINEFNFEKSEDVKLAEQMYLRRLMDFSGDFSDKNEKSRYGEPLSSGVGLQPVFVSVMFAESLDKVRLYDTYAKKVYTKEAVTLTNQTGVINTRKAAASLENLASVHSGDASFFLQKAGLYADVHDYTAALDNYNQVIAQKTDMVMAWFGRANTRFKLIELLNSEYDMQYLADSETDFRNFNPYEKTSQTYSYEDVLKDYNKVIALDPGFPYAWYNRGFVKSLVGDYWGAVSDFSKAIELNPELGEAYFNKGLILIFQQLKAVGCRNLSDAGELGVDEAYDVMERFCNR